MIGIFDSGSGGLTVLKALREELPSADVIYFGDIKNTPYGGKSQEELSILTVQGLSLLKNRGAQHLVSACNSVSASLALSLIDALDLTPAELVEMVGPTVRYFKDTDLKLAICATPATIRSGIYQNGFKMVGKDVLSIPIPDLARAIEFEESPERIGKIISDALDTHKNTFDVLILACTHYPLVLDVFREVVGNEVAVFDPAVAVAKKAQKLFWPREVGSGTTRFFISQDSPIFRKRVEAIFGIGQEAIEVLTST